jgi:hypothetical protein
MRALSCAQGPRDGWKFLRGLPEHLREIGPALALTGQLPEIAAVAVRGPAPQHKPCVTMQL